MSSNTKNLIIAAAAIVVVVAVAIIVPHLKHAAPMEPETAPATTPAATTTTTKAGSPTLTASGWTAMLSQYSGRLVVLDASCQATPYSQVQPLGGKVLLANNSNVSHVVIAGAGQGGTIAPYHYKVITMDNSSIMNISCDSNQKAASITVK